MKEGICGRNLNPLYFYPANRYNRGVKLDAKLLARWGRRTPEKTLASGSAPIAPPAPRSQEAKYGGRTMCSDYRMSGLL